MTAGLPRSRTRRERAQSHPPSSESATLQTAAFEVFGSGKFMTATPNFASDALSVGAGDAAAPASNAGPFVLNLCSSTTPMALAQTDLAELKRFTFFVSRRFEEGRERFRLHMGYFATLAESEEWLSVVREIYPGAWAGEAPGRKLRERATAAQAAQAQHAAGPQQQVSTPRPAPAPARPAAPAPTRQPSPAEALSMRVPVLKAAPAATPAAAVAKPAAAKAPPVRSSPVQPAQPAAPVAPTSRAPAPPSVPRTMTAPAPAQKSAVPAPRAAAAVSASQAPQKLPAAAKTAPPAPPKDEKLNSPEKGAMGAKGAFGDSNVREVLKALGDASATGETRLMRAPLAPPAKETAASAPQTKPPSDISDTQVLRLLETRRAEGASEAPPPAQDPAHGAIPLLKPDDTGTREALKDAVSTNAPVLFAVQLQWSVQAVELDKVPPLAIFSAYTLYTVEGSRDGRKWYGLRLGFFSDAISAKQVAHYVRSEFTSVAVVPVSSQEKSRATDQDKQAATLGAPAATRAPVDEFKLIDDDTAAAEVAKIVQQAPAPAAKPLMDAAGRKIPGRPIPKVAVGRTVIQPAALAGAPATPAPAKTPAPPKPAGRSAGKVGAREKRGPQSLEETLEILGAGQLSIDNGTGATLNDSGVRHLRVEVQKNSPFSKLLERLSERMKKS